MSLGVDKEEPEGPRPHPPHGHPRCPSGSRKGKAGGQCRVLDSSSPDPRPPRLVGVTCLCRIMSVCSRLCGWMDSRRDWREQLRYAETETRLWEGSLCIWTLACGQGAGAGESLGSAAWRASGLEAVPAAPVSAPPVTKSHRHTGTPPSPPTWSPAPLLENSWASGGSQDAQEWLGKVTCWPPVPQVESRADAFPSPTS